MSGVFSSLKDNISF